MLREFMAATGMPMGIVLITIVVTRIAYLWRRSGWRSAVAVNNKFAFGIGIAGVATFAALLVNGGQTLSVLGWTFCVAVVLSALWLTDRAVGQKQL